MAAACCSADICVFTKDIIYCDMLGSLSETIGSLPEWISQFIVECEISARINGYIGRSGTDQWRLDIWMEVLDVC